MWRRDTRAARAARGPRGRLVRNVGLRIQRSRARPPWFPTPVVSARLDQFDAESCCRRTDLAVIRHDPLCTELDHGPVRQGGRPHATAHPFTGLQDGHVPPAVGQPRRRHQAGEPCANHQHPPRRISHRDGPFGLGSSSCLGRNLRGTVRLWYSAPSGRCRRRPRERRRNHVWTSDGTPEPVAAAILAPSRRRSHRGTQPRRDPRRVREARHHRWRRLHRRSDRTSLVPATLSRSR